MGGHLEQKAGVALVRAGLQFAHCFDLIITQIVRVLRDGDEIRFDRFLRKAAWIGLEGAAVADGFARGELGDDLGVAVFEIPEIVNIAIGEDDKAHVLGIGVGARLLFADEGIFLLPFSFDDEEGKVVLIEEKVIGIPLAGMLEVLTEGIEIMLGDGCAGFEMDGGRAVLIREEAPASGAQECVDLDACLGF